MGLYIMIAFGYISNICTYTNIVGGIVIILVSYITYGTAAGVQWLQSLILDSTNYNPEDSLICLTYKYILELMWTHSRL